MSKEIPKLYAVLSLDEEGNEGIVYMENEKRMTPLISGDEEMLNRMYTLAAAQAVKSGKAVKVILFERVGEVENPMIEVADTGGQNADE